MEKELETTAEGLGLLPPILENQTEKKKEHALQTGIRRGFWGGYQTSCMTLSTLYLLNCGTTVYEGEAGGLVSTVLRG